MWLREIQESFEHFLDLVFPMVNFIRENLDLFIDFLKRNAVLIYRGGSGLEIGICIIVMKKVEFVYRGDCPFI